jgi:hypothetical protein
MLVVFFPVPADFVYMYCTQPPAQCCQLSTIFFCRPIQKKGKGYTEEERKERKKDNLFSQQHTMQYIRSMNNQNHLTYV